jgi:hypothetical protein
MKQISGANDRVLKNAPTLQIEGARQARGKIQKVVVLFCARIKCIFRELEADNLLIKLRIS